MPSPVHILACRPLTRGAVAEFVALPTGPPVGDDFEAVDVELARRGWVWEEERVSGSFITGYGHVLCSDGRNPFGHPQGRSFLVFGEVYPAQERDEHMTGEPWLLETMDLWTRTPGWERYEACSDQDCEALLTRAARAVTQHLGTPPERTVLSDAAVVVGPAMTHRIWRTPTHALILGPAADNGPYGYLTHLQLSCTPLGGAPELPPAVDGDALTEWITAHVDW
ncbi:hypothetical protein [Streptomyces microflavus]|uniref:hypothetical protein n=1 Tax=Streptomyces microflavus TaxID=1919 RepID=UPI002E2F89D5|nr:hypothetical protein [Streptomyces microflavus]